MYITGMSTEHCTIFSVISGLHDLTTDFYCTQPLYYCTPKSTGLITDLLCEKVVSNSFSYVKVLLLLPYTLAAMRKINSLMEVVADKPLMYCN